MNNLLIATTPITAEPIVPTPDAYLSLYSEAEITKIKNAYNTSKTYFSSNQNEKARIDLSGDVFIDATDKTYWRWTSVPTLDAGGKVPLVRNDPNDDMSRTSALQIRDAAFIAFATDNNTLKTTIKNELVAQSGIYVTNLSNPIWVQGRYASDDVIFNIGEWYSAVITAYLYTESAFSDLEKSDFLNNYIVPSTHFLVEETQLAFYSLLGGRNVNNNTSPPYTVPTLTDSNNWFAYKTAGGVQTNRTNTLMRRYNNRAIGYMILPALLAYVATNNTYFRNTCEMFVKEVLVYGWFADGSYNEFYRSTLTKSQITGMGYSSVTSGFCSYVAWVFWKKDGDSSLFDYTTSLGNQGTEGGSKSLLWTVKEYAKHFDGTYLRYKYEDAVSADSLMNGRVNGGNQRIITDATWMGIPLMEYYSSDTDLRNQIERIGSGYDNVRYVDTTSPQSFYWGGDNNGGVYSALTFGFSSMLMEMYELTL